MAKPKHPFPKLAKVVFDLSGEVQSFSGEIAPYELATMLVSDDPSIRITKITDEQLEVLRGLADTIREDGSDFESLANRWKAAMDEVERTPGAVISTQDVGQGHVAAQTARRAASGPRRKA